MKKRTVCVLVISVLLVQSSLAEARPKPLHKQYFDQVNMQSADPTFESSDMPSAKNPAGKLEVRAATKHKGVYFTSPGDCDIIAPPKPKPSSPAAAKLPFKIDDGLKEVKLNPFSKFVLKYNSTVQIHVYKGAKAAVYASDPKAVKQVKDTVFVEAYSSRFVVVTDSLDSIRNLDNGSIVVKGIDAPFIHVSVESNGVVNVTGKVQAAQIDVLENGDAALQKLLISKRAIVKVLSNGSAHVNAKDFLSATISSNGQIYYCGNPAHIEKSLDGMSTFDRESNAPDWHQSIDHGW